MPSFASSSANRIPMQLLERRRGENHRSVSFAYRGPSPNGRYVMGGRLAFSVEENLSKVID